MRRLSAECRVATTLMVSSPLLATYRNCPSGVMAMPFGIIPTGIVATVVYVRRSRAVTVSSAAFMMYAVCASGLTTTSCGATLLAADRQGEFKLHGLQDCNTVHGGDTE